MEQDPTQKQPDVVEEGGEGPSKKALKKAEKEAAKLAKKAEYAKAKPQQSTQDEGEDPLKDNYGDVILIQSQDSTDRKWVGVGEIDDSHVGQEILVRARLHSSRVKGKIGFLVLREKFSDIQAVINETEGQVSKKMIKWVAALAKESIIDVYGEVKKPEQEIQSCSQKVELHIKRVYCISRAHNTLPFQLDDASRPIQKGEIEMENYDAPVVQEKAEEKKEDIQATVSLKTRLDNRVIDLRTKANHAIMRVQSGVCQLFREFLYTQGFIEIHTPKLISGTSEGGANVFKMKYFDREACLAQSPQLYKQMCVMADFDRVFEVGPVFRAENSFTHRHMCEFTGLDIEMAIKENYNEIFDLIGELFAHIFGGLETRFAKELEAINVQYPFDAFKFKRPVVKLTFQEGIELLKENGVEWPAMEDLDTATERKLGELVKKKYDTDFYILHRYPITARPFYTMPCKDDPRYTNSYDFFMRGEEITSGAQRIHDSELLAKRAEECGIQVDTIKDYIESFKYGAHPHGGVGIGLERVVMLYCALGNIRKSTLFPRDPKRITP